MAFLFTRLKPGVNERAYSLRILSLFKVQRYHNSSRRFADPLAIPVTACAYRNEAESQVFKKPLTLVLQSFPFCYKVRSLNGYFGSKEN